MTIKWYKYAIYTLYDYDKILIHRNPFKQYSMPVEGFMSIQKLDRLKYIINATANFTIQNRQFN